MGAWIEIRVVDPDMLNKRSPPYGAWIEIFSLLKFVFARRVAPVWGRGLKSLEDDRVYLWSKSPPYGGVD